MKRSFNTRKIIAVLAVGTLAVAVLGAFLRLRKGSDRHREIVSEPKNWTKNLRKKAQKKAKNMQKEEWLANEKDKIMSHAK